MTFKGYDYMPGVPSAGHITRGGFWHPGALARCAKCNPEPPKKRKRPAN